MFNDADWDDDIFANLNSFGKDDEECSCDGNCSKKKESEECCKKKVEPDICQKCGEEGKVDRCACICPKCGHIIWGC